LSPIQEYEAIRQISNFASTVDRELQPSPETLVIPVKAGIHRTPMGVQ